MPFFDSHHIHPFISRHPSADEHELDLRGVDPMSARQAIEWLLERWRYHRIRRVLIRIDPPAGNGEETLFLPVGRQLLAARRGGLIAHLNTLPAARGEGFYIEFADYPASDSFESI